MKSQRIDRPVEGVSQEVKDLILAARNTNGALALVLATYGEELPPAAYRVLRMVQKELDDAIRNEGVRT